MTRAHFTIRHVHGRHIAFCRCTKHDPVGAWTAADLNRKIQEAKP